MEEEVEETSALRPDWWMPASVAVRTAANVVGSVAEGFGMLAGLMTAYSEYEDQRRDFHKAASLEIERIVGEG